MKQLLISLSLIVFAAKAQAALDPEYFSIGSMEVREISEADIALEKSKSFQDNAVVAETDVWFANEPLDRDVLGNMIGLSGAEVGVFLRVGKEIWRIITENQPVLSTSYDMVSILPKEVTDWQQMEGWNVPTSKAYEVSYRNLYGIEVIKFSYRVTYTAGGTFNGKGKYLSNLAVSPIRVRVLWGFNLTADVAIKNIQNTATSTDPIPATEVQINYKVSTLFVKEEASEILYVRGDGYSKKLK